MAERAAVILTALSGFFIWIFFHQPWVPPEEIRVLLGMLLAVWGVAALLIGVPYARRWGGSWRDAAVVAAAVWLALALPTLPLVAAGQFSPIPVLSAALYSAILSSVARYQGRYRYSPRRLPEVQGEARAAVLAVLEKAGLKAAALFSVVLPTYNAMVQGLKTCVLIVDRRATREMTTDELTAVVAHEGGHLRRGDTLIIVLIPAVAVTVGVCAGLIREDDAVALPVAIALLLGLGPAILRCVELRADRFAASLVGARAMERSLARLHADRSAALERAISAPILSAFLGHPPLEVRRVALGEASARPSPIHAAGAFLAVMLALSAPALALVDSLPKFAAAVPALVIAVLWIAPRVWIQLAVRRSSAIALTHSMGSWLPLVLLLGTAIAVVAVFRFGPKDLQLPLGLATCVPLVGYLVFFRRRQARGLASQPSAVRRAVTEAYAAIEEGAPEKGLEPLAEVSATNAWVLSARGTCLLVAARFAEARTALEAALAKDPRPLATRYNLALSLFMSGDLDGAKARMTEVCKLAPHDSMGWRVLGTILADMGDQDGAREAFARALRIKPAEPMSRAGLAHLAMDEERPAAEVDALLAAAEEMGPRSGAVALARARAQVRRGAREEAAQNFAEAVRRISYPELKFWVPYYEAQARRWGIVPPA